MVLLGEQNINTEYEAVRYCAVRDEPHFRTRFVEVEVAWNLSVITAACVATPPQKLYYLVHKRACMCHYLVPGTAAKKVLHKKKCRNQPTCVTIFHYSCMLVRIRQL